MNIFVEYITDFVMRLLYISINIFCFFKFDLYSFS